MLRCCRCKRPLLAAAAWRDPVPNGPGTALPGALGAVCAAKEGLQVAAPNRKRKNAGRRGGKKSAAQLTLGL